MLNFLWTKEKAKCVHPKWEVIKEIAMPSIAEQMQLETLLPEQKAETLAKLQPSDFNKSFLLIMSCPFCGEVKEFKTEHTFQAERVCNHQWEIHDTLMASSFEKTCGADATFEQRRQIAAKMEPNDFSSSLQRRMVCKICGEYTDHSFSEDRDGAESGKRCAHQWKTVVGDALDTLENRYSKILGDYREIRIKQAVLLACEICGATATRELNSVITLHPEIPARKK